MGLSKIFGLILVIKVCLSTDQLMLCLRSISDKYFKEKFLVIVYWTDKRDYAKTSLLPDVPAKLKKGVNNNKKEIHDGEKLSKLMVKMYFPKCISNRNREYSQKKMSIQDTMIKDFTIREKWTMKIFTGEITDELNQKPKRKTQNIVFLMDVKGDLNMTKLIEEIKVNKKKALWRTQGQILVVIWPGNRGDGEHRAKTILQALWLFRKACNVVVLVVTEEQKFDLYKWYPYKNECDTLCKITLVDVWTNGKFSNNRELFSRNGVTNLNGCTLKVGAFPNPPYILNPKGERTNFTRGVDIKIINALADYYNFTINFTTLPEGMFPYIIFDSEGKASGFHGMLQKQEIDIMIFGCRIHELRNLIGDPLDPYTEDALVWVVPTPGHVPSWRNLGDAFTPIVWLLLGVFFTLISFTLYLTANCQKNVVEHQSFRSLISCAFSTLAVLLNHSVAEPRSTLLRFFMIFFSLYAINATSAYQSSLIALLTGSRYEKEFVKPMDAIKAGMKTYLFPSGNLTYNQTDHDIWNIIFQPERHGFIEDFVPVLREIALKKTGMVMMAQNVANFEIQTKYMTHDKTPRAIFLKEKFSLYKVTAYVSMGHPLREHFRQKVNQMVEGGLIEYWLSNVLFSAEQQFVSNQEEKKGPRPLSLQHLQGPFFILIIVLLVSIQVFFFELLLRKLTKSLQAKLK